MSARPAAQWWTTAFRRWYLDVYAHRDDASARREAAFVASLLGILPGARLLDAGCGAGRHARAFAALGADVFGIDLSEELLAEARRRGRARCARADFRRLPFRDGTFAHVASLFTSFGYFDDAGDRAQLGEFRRVLRARGTLVLDFLNAPRVRSTLVGVSTRLLDPHTSLRETRGIVGNRVEKLVELVDEHEFETHDRWTESVRLYERDELSALLVAADFRVTSACGDLAGGPWSESSERLVVAAEAA